MPIATGHEREELEAKLEVFFIKINLMCVFVCATHTCYVHLIVLESIDCVLFLLFHLGKEYYGDG